MARLFFSSLNVALVTAFHVRYNPFLDAAWVYAFFLGVLRMGRTGTQVEILPQ